MNTKLVIATIALAAWALPTEAVQAGGKAFPKTVPALTGAPPEGFAIGRGSTAYNSSIDGSIYKVDLRSGEGEVLVEAEPDFDIFQQCFKLGMRVDPRSNYLFVAGCLVGNAMVFDAETGEELANYKLATFGTVINDLAITRDAVYFTDFTQPALYRLPLAKNGRLPSDPATMQITLSNPNEDGPNTANGIVATPNGDTLIIGDSTTASIYRVDPATGHSDRIVVDPPLVGFIDGIAMHKGLLYILTPFGDGSGPDWIQVVELDKEMLTGTRVGVITDPDMNGVASGAFFGGSLYVNNARYADFTEAPPGPDAEFWLTRLSTRDVQP